MICAYILLGLSYAEIGEQIGITTRAVEYRMRALRKHVNKLVERGVVEPPRWAREKQQPADAREIA
ncbi:MAG: sigma-70 region 4 domain-containing protein [Actinomycetota bacterium]|jgi:DNA-directed RNA polymerase specialized sigma24 family protein|nr:sigma-70 region 4 domain-containing protein [Actinomycetota bacterium]